MGKPKNSMQKGGKPPTAKSINDAKIKKNKAPPAFKQTPKGKVAVINGKKNGKENTEKTQLNKSVPQPKVPANSNVNKKQKNTNSKTNPTSKQSPQKKKNSKAVKATTDESISDEDINEGIVVEEQISVVGADDDDSSDDELTPDILGASLADDSDDDDEDFEADSDDEANKKGVKMFKGITIEAMDEDDDDNEDVEDETDDDDNEDVEDETDDDDNEDAEDEDEDEDEENTSANETASTFNTSTEMSLKLETSSADDDDDDDEDDDNDDDEEEDDDDDENPGLKALLNHSLVDDEDDEDFTDDGEDDEDDEINESEEDEDENDESQSDKNISKDSTTSKGKSGKLSPEEKAKLDKRTIFIGNVPKDTTESRIRNEFKKFGAIETLRVRGVVPESPKMSYKWAAIKRKIHEKVTTIYVFVTYEKEESAKAALVMNGKKLDGNYLRVDTASQDRPFEPKKTVFIGNLPFDVLDNELWELFGKCGKVEYVRTIRDRNTGTTRGIAYVAFKSEDGVALALDLNGTELRSRELRVERYSAEKKAEKKSKAFTGAKKRLMSKQGQIQSSKKIKTEAGPVTKSANNSTQKVEKKAKRSQGEKQRSPGAANVKKEKNGSFQGQKAEVKKNGKKFNKFEKKKKALAGKLMAKSKKPVA